MIKIEWKFPTEPRLTKTPMDMLIVLGERYVAFQVGPKLTKTDIKLIEKGVNTLLSDAKDKEQKKN